MAQHSDTFDTQYDEYDEYKAPAQDAPVMAKAKSMRDRILGLADTKRRRLFVEEWNETIEIRGMSGKGRSRFIKRISGDDMEDVTVDIEMYNPALIIETVYDPETGEQLFQPGDEELINTRASDVLDRIAKIASELSGMDKMVEKELGKP